MCNYFLLKDCFGSPGHKSTKTTGQKKKTQKQQLLINGTRLTKKKKKYPNNINKVYSTKVRPGGGMGGTE